MCDIKSRIYVLFASLIMLSALYPMDSSAIPAFARKNNLACSTCHSAWPMLNSAGRHYKENGYRFSKLDHPNVTITENLSWDENLPVSVALAARPYDKKDQGERKLRAIHEVELMVAGPMGEKMSSFFEIEAEDEFVNNLGQDVSVATAELTYSHNDAVNLQFSYADAMWFDAYSTYSNARRLTRGSTAVVSQGFGGADNGGALSSVRQNFTLYGRPVSNFLYGVSLSGLADDSEGVDGQTLTTRLAYEMTPDIMLGVMLMDGTCSIESGAAACVTNDRDYSRSAVDLEMTLANVVLTSVYMKAEDDNSTATASVENNAFYLQAAYIFSDTGRATWVPLLRYDEYEKNNGVESISELTLTMAHYFSENIQAYIELWDRSGDGATADDDRVTVQLMAAF